MGPASPPWRRRTVLPEHRPAPPAGTAHSGGIGGHHRLRDRQVRFGGGGRVSSALVLGGGGVAGIAWELGVLLGLREAGASVEDADSIVGTSAGSVVGALVAGDVDLVERFEAQLAPQSSERAVPFDLEAMTEQFAAAIGQARTPQERLARIGALAIETGTAGEEERRAIIASRLPFSGWPDRDLWITAITADTGDLVVFERTSGVDLVDAVAAS